MPDSRTRMLIFRVTHQEYDRLKVACTAAGGRSLSEFLRTFLFTTLSSESKTTAVQKRLDEIDEKLTGLDVMVKRLAESKGSERIGII